MDILIMQAFAEEAPQMLTQTQTFLDNITTWINSLSGIASVSVIGGLIFEFLLRYVKTERPKSIFLGIKSIFDVLGKIFISLSNICIAISRLLDKIIPQRLLEKQEEKK